jgi:hypothetical protein
MKRPTLSIARASTRSTRPPLSLVKKALRLFKGRGVTKATYRANALKWIAASRQLGDKHLLRGGAATWGRPGEPKVDQVFAPRRMRAGER